MLQKSLQMGLYTLQIMQELTINLLALMKFMTKLVRQVILILLLVYGHLHLPSLALN